jgi:hypothetical protein
MDLAYDIASEILDFLIGRGGFAEHEDMPHRHRAEFPQAVALLVQNKMVRVYVSPFDGLTTYRMSA